jgi:hypothetical protein
MTGGEISGNTTFNLPNWMGTITETPGVGVYLSSGTFSMSGSAFIAEDNYVELGSGAFISIAGSLSGASPVATITASAMANGTKVLGSSPSYMSTQADISKFAVTDPSYTITTSGASKGRLLSYASILQNLIADSAGSELVIPISDSFALNELVTIPANKTVTLAGSGTLSRSSNYTGNLITVGADAHFILGSDEDPADSLIIQNKFPEDSGNAIAVFGGTFTMKNSATIDGKSGPGSTRGVTVESGTFYMTGGKIINHVAPHGAVHIDPGGDFIMSGGSIENNTNSWWADSYGAGVKVYGTFNMTGGSIIGNHSYTGGGGVFVATSGVFTKTGGVVSGNTVSTSQNLQMYIEAGGSYTGPGTSPYNSAF